MKKLTICLLAVVFIAGVFAQSAIADDRLSLSGSMRVRAWSLENYSDFDSDNGTDKLQYWDQRFRLAATIKVAEGVTGHLRFDFAEEEWGNDDWRTVRYVGDNELQVDRTYLQVEKDLFVLKAGQILFGLGNYIVYDSQRTGVGLTLKLPVTVTLVYTKEDENGSYFEEIYENYNAWGMTMNGTFSSTSQGNWPWYDSTDTGNNSFEIINICTENMTISFDTGATYTYVSSFKDKYTNNQYVILEGEFEYNSSDGDNYSYRILEPVVTNFLCENSYIPVSGIEQWTESTTIYEIDYGNGNCDNKATITENGKVYEVDFDEFIDSVKVQTGDSTLVGP